MDERIKFKDQSEEKIDDPIEFKVMSLQVGPELLTIPIPTGPKIYTRIKYYEGY